MTNCSVLLFKSIYHIYHDSLLSVCTSFQQIGSLLMLSGIPVWLVGDEDESWPLVGVLFFLFCFFCFCVCVHARVCMRVRMCLCGGIVVHSTFMCSNDSWIMNFSMCFLLKIFYLFPIF